MDCIELRPNLSHCIEAAAREEFRTSAVQYMKAGCKDEKLGQKIQLLRAFLESADFKKLRAQSERHLVEGQKVRFVIWRTGSKTSYEMVVT